MILVVKVLLVMLGIPILLVVGSFIVCFLPVKLWYEKTVYYTQTHNSFWTTFLNKGTKGEFLIWKCLDKLPGYKKFLFNCYLPKDNGETTEIDVILLHESGIYVFESKNYSGWIFGTETQQYWTQVLLNRRRGAQKFVFFNPIIQNVIHLKWLCKYLNRSHEGFYSYIVFGEHTTLKKIVLTSGLHCVINRTQMLPIVFVNAWRKMGTLTSYEIDDLYTNLYPFTQINEEIKINHIKSIQKKNFS